MQQFACEKERVFKHWNFKDGWVTPNPDPEQKDTVDGNADPYAGLRTIMDLDGDGSQAWDSCVLAMVGTEALIGQHPPFDECLRQYARAFAESHRRLILVTTEEFILPTKLQHDIPVLDFDLPSRDELREVFLALVSGVAEGVDQPYTEEEIARLVALGSGMTEAEFELAVAKAVALRKKDWPNIELQHFANLIAESKTEIVKRSEVLELMKAEDPKNIGGLEMLKQWINRRKKIFCEDARDYGVDPPKGCILIGPPGCLSGETVMSYRRGKRNSSRSITLENLYKNFNGIPTDSRPWDARHDTYLHSFNSEHGSVQYNRIVSVIDSGVKQVYCLNTTNGRNLTLTADHPVLTDTGFRPCRELKEGDTLIVRGSMKPQAGSVRHGRQPRIVVEGLRFYSGGWTKDVICHSSESVYSYKRQHKARLVIEAHLNGMTYDAYVFQLRNEPTALALQTLDKRLMVHHVDENPMNDALDNLIVMEKPEHDALHNDESKFNVNYTDLDQVAYITKGGYEQTYDVQMASPNNNFCTHFDFIVHNTGKSMCAKAIAGELGLPLIKFDVSRCFAGIVGQTEGKVRSALTQVQAMAPCVILLDEVDKAGIDPRQAGGDGGVSKRVMGSILTFMQESTAPMFWVLTANRADSLPPELLRKGRMDEVFSVLPPNAEERTEIIRIHLSKRKQKMLKGADLQSLVDASRGYVGAEIEAAIKEAVVDAYTDGIKVTGDTIRAQLACMKPISVAFKEDFDKMSAWADNNARPSSLKEAKSNSNKPLGAAVRVVRRGRLLE